MSVSHASASIPVALRMATASRWISAADMAWVNRIKCFLDPLDGAALTERELRALDWIGLEGEAEHRALLCLGSDDHPRERVHDEVEPGRDVVGCVVGQ